MPTDQDCFQQLSIYKLHWWNNCDKNQCCNIIHRIKTTQNKTTPDYNNLNILNCYNLNILTVNCPDINDMW